MRFKQKRGYKTEISCRSSNTYGWEGTLDCCKRVLFLLFIFNYWHFRFLHTLLVYTRLKRDCMHGLRSCTTTYTHIPTYINAANGVLFRRAQNEESTYLLDTFESMLMDKSEKFCNWISLRRISSTVRLYGLYCSLARPAHHYYTNLLLLFLLSWLYTLKIQCNALKVELIVWRTDWRGSVALTSSLFFRLLLFVFSRLPE